MPFGVQHLFSSAGSWVAFRRGKYVYNTSGKWIGWLPWNDQDVVNVNGEYLGTICWENWLYHVHNHPYRGYPGFAGYAPLPIGASDVNISESE